MTDAADERGYAIRERAHEIWVRLGHANGLSLDHWIQAESELIAEYHLQPNSAPPDAAQTHSEEVDAV